MTILDVKRLSIQDLKAMLSAVVANAEAGETFVITRHSEPVARLSAAGPPHASRRSHRQRCGALRDAGPHTRPVFADAVAGDRHATPLDLAHLRTALWFHAEGALDRFVTMDRAQREAAKELGLPV